ncbi:MBL fold metallo-hydrolase [Brevundimonas sp.]|uniref:MBL fold metallo-hydrolase n=1 Tax=Brevundimonas sp. TaxID=1871086 RepID=UPI0035B126E4
MADGQPVQDGEAARGLAYSGPPPPMPGEAVEVADGVLWLRFRLPMALDHVNGWALRDGDGWLIVDTGLNLPDTREAWEAVLAGPLGGRPVTRVLATHMHPDHIGLVGWLCERFEAPLLMSRLEYVTARMLMADTGPAPEGGAAFYRAAGWDEGRIEAWRSGYGRFAMGVAPLPPSYRRIVGGERLRIDGRDWRLVAGEGHSPEHVGLWRLDDGVFISGDQVLPKISSNVSVWPTEPLADPLGDWIAACERLRSALPADLYVLPSHGEPFNGLHPRLDALVRGHGVALKRLKRRLAEPARAVDVFGSLFARPVSDGVYAMATGEAVAHLNYLERRGRAERRRDGDGVDWWRATGPEETET